jgi:hypothetical protein
LGKTFEDLLVEGKYIGSDSYTVMQEWMFDVGKITGIVQKVNLCNDFSNYK